MIKSNIFAVVFGIGCLAQPAAADPAFSLGLTVNFGSGQSTGLGITAGIWSDNRKDQGTAGVLATFYPSTNQFGAGLGVGYNFDNAIAMLGYDFIQQNAQFGIGFANIETDDDDDDDDDEMDMEDDIIESTETDFSELTFSIN